MHFTLQFFSGVRLMNATVSLRTSLGSSLFIIVLGLAVTLAFWVLLALADADMMGAQQWQAQAQGFDALSHVIFGDQIASAINTTAAPSAAAASTASAIL
jgi:hypothetical protein